MLFTNPGPDVENPFPEVDSRNDDCRRIDPSAVVCAAPPLGDPDDGLCARPPPVADLGLLRLPIALVARSEPLRRVEAARSLGLIQSADVGE